MRRIIDIINSALFFLFFAAPAYAQTEVKVCPDNDPMWRKLCEIANGDIGSKIGTVIVIILIIAVVLALFFLIWGGIKWILSGGDKSAVEAARNTIIAAIIGLVIALASFFILQVVLKIFGLDLFHLTLPAFHA